MTNTTAATYNVRTAAGTIHRITIGRTYKQYGSTCINRDGASIGRADCNSQTSGAATVTTEAVTCPKCLAK